MERVQCILRKINVAALALVVGAFASASAQEANRKTEPLMIQGQGSTQTTHTYSTKCRFRLENCLS
jgi:hypothetical protein